MRVVLERRLSANRSIASIVWGEAFFARNIASPQQALELSAEIKSCAGSCPVLSNVDQEGRRVMRLKQGGTPVPSMRTLGSLDDVPLTRQIGRVLAREMRALGIDQVNAPVLDVDTNPANPVIACRSFGRTPELVSRLGVALIDGIQSEGVAACGTVFQLGKLRRVGWGERIPQPAA